MAGGPSLDGEHAEVEHEGPAGEFVVEVDLDGVGDRGHVAVEAVFRLDVEAGLRGVADHRLERLRVVLRTRSGS